MNKAKLLKLINEDEEIREAILDIFNHEEPVEDVTKEQKEIEVLKGLVEKWKKCFSDEERKTENLTQELTEQKKSLSQDISELQKEKDRLLTTNEQLQAKNSQLTSLNNGLENSVQQLHFDNKTIQSSNTKLNETIEFYRKNFEEELKAYELFSSLSDETKSSLSGIFKDTSLKGFVSCGVQEKNISSFWEYIKVELQEEKNSDIDALIQIYSFLFEQFIKAFPIYALQKVEAGETFDPQAHINHSSSMAVSGTIQELIFQGYTNTKTSKIIKQSVVRVG